MRFVQLNLPKSQTILTVSIIPVQMICFDALQAPANWNGGVGHISKEMIQEHCPRPAPDIMVVSLVFLKAFFLHLNHAVQLVPQWIW